MNSQEECAAVVVAIKKTGKKINKKAKDFGESVAKSKK